MVEKKAVRSSSLERWCLEAGGKFYDENHTRTTGYFGCNLDGDRIEVTKRSNRPNTISLKSERVGMHRLGLSKDADLVYGSGSNQWVETTGATLGTNNKTTGLIQSGTKGSKIPLREKRKKQSSMWHERRTD